MRKDGNCLALVATMSMAAASPALAQSTPTPTPSPTPTVTYPSTAKVPRNAFQTDLYQRSSIRSPELLRSALADRAEARRIYESQELHADSYRWAQRVAECIVEEDGDQAASLIAPDQYDELARAASTRYRWCLLQKAPEDAVELRNATLETLNSALAESMIIRDGITYEDRAPMVDVNEAERFSGVVPGADIDLDMIGRCVAVYSPGLVQRVLEAEPGSSEEQAALEQLYRTTPECGVNARPAKIPSSLQRVAVAKGLYLWTSRS